MTTAAPVGSPLGDDGAQPLQRSWTMLRASAASPGPGVASGPLQGA